MKQKEPYWNLKHILCAIYATILSVLLFLELGSYAIYVIKRAEKFHRSCAFYAFTFVNLCCDSGFWMKENTRHSKTVHIFNAQKKIQQYCINRLHIVNCEIIVELIFISM